MLSVAFYLIGITAFSKMTQLSKCTVFLCLSMKGIFATLSINRLLGLICDARLAKVVMLSVAFYLIGIMAFSKMTQLSKCTVFLCLSMKGIFATLSINRLLLLICDARLAKVVMLSVSFYLIIITAFSKMTQLSKCRVLLCLSMKGIFATPSINRLLGLICDTRLAKVVMLSVAFYLIGIMAFSKMTIIVIMLPVF